MQETENKRIESAQIQESLIKFIPIWQSLYFGVNNFGLNMRSLKFRTKILFSFIDWKCNEVKSDEFSFFFCHKNDKLPVTFRQRVTYIHPNYPLILESKTSGIFWVFSSTYHQKERITPLKEVSMYTETGCYLQPQWIVSFLHAHIHHR